MTEEEEEEEESLFKGLSRERGGPQKEEEEEEDSPRKTVEKVRQTKETKAPSRSASLLCLLSFVVGSQ